MRLIAPHHNLSDDFCMMSEYITSGDIARQLGCPLHRVTYALQRLGIVEDSRAGTYRLFRRERLPEITDAIHAIGTGKTQMEVYP